MLIKLLKDTLLATADGLKTIQEVLNKNLNVYDNNWKLQEVKISKLGKTITSIDHIRLNNGLCFDIPHQSDLYIGVSYTPERKVKTYFEDDFESRCRGLIKGKALVDRNGNYYIEFKRVNDSKDKSVAFGEGEQLFRKWWVRNIPVEKQSNYHYCGLTNNESSVVYYINKAIYDRCEEYENRSEFWFGYLLACKYRIIGDMCIKEYDVQYIIRILGFFGYVCCVDSFGKLTVYDYDINGKFEEHMGHICGCKTEKNVECELVSIECSRPLIIEGCVRLGG